MGALPAVGGSVISILLGAFFVWAILSLLVRRFEFSVSHSDMRLACTFSAFPALVLLTALTGEHSGTGALKSLLLLPFLSLWVMIPRLRAGRGNYIPHYVCGAACGAIGAIVFATFQWTIPMRPEGGAGNPAVFAIMVLALTAVASLNITSRDPIMKGLSWAGVLAGLTSVVIALVRGVWIATVFIVAGIFCYAPKQFKKPAVLWSAAAVLAFIVVSVVLIAPSFSSFTKNFTHSASSLSRIFLNLDSETGVRSVDLRIDMWSGAWRAFLDSPWIGYGIQNGMDALRAHLPADVAEEIIFTHAHNGFLTFALDGGIVLLGSVIAMLAMPVVIAWRAPRDETHRKRLFLALLVSGVYALCGMTQIMFRHDIMDSFFIFNTIVVAASIPSRTVTEAETENLTRLDIRQEDD
jgi:O-antigen ligase